MLDKISSLFDLNKKLETDVRYIQLVIITANFYGYDGNDFEKAMDKLNVITQLSVGCSEIVSELNFQRNFANFAMNETIPTRNIVQIHEQIDQLREVATNTGRPVVTARQTRRNEQQPNYIHWDILIGYAE